MILNYNLQRFKYKCRWIVVSDQPNENHPTNKDLDLNHYDLK